MDSTLAVSEGGAKHLVDRLLTLATASDSNSASWGPFTVAYSASVALSSIGTTTVQLIDAPVNHIRVNNINVSGNLTASFTFDLGAILPTICIPPFQVCVNIPFVGRVCTPQVCISWPSVTASVNLPFSFNVSAEFGISVQSSPTTWDVAILVFPFLTSFDFTPMAGVITSAISAAVSSALSSIPLIGGLLASLVSTVLGAFTGVLTGILSVFNTFVNGLIALINLFAPTPIPIGMSFAKTQPFLPANFPSAGDLEVDLTIAALNASVIDHELVATADFA